MTRGASPLLSLARPKVPFDRFFSDDDGGGQAMALVSVGKVLKAAKILRLNKLLRGSMLELYEDLMSSSATMRFTIKLTKLLVGMSFTLHYFACFW